MIWVLDACVLIRAQDAGALADLLAASGSCPMEVTEEVYQEVTDPASNKVHVLNLASVAKGLIDGSACRVVSIPLDWPVAKVVAYLRGARTTANDAGECASIAYVSLEPGRCFVTSDRAATFVSTRESDGGTVSLPWFLRKLVEQGALSAPLAAGILAADKTPVPAWWTAWTSNV